MPYAAMLFVVIFWGSAAAVGRSMGEADTPLGLALWRVALGLALLLLVQAAAAAKRRFAQRRSARYGQSRSNPPLRRYFPLWIGGILGYTTMFWLFFEAARATLSSHLVLILAMAPICTMLLNRITGGRGNARALLPAALSLAGIAVMIAPSSSGGASLFGDFMAILALLAFSGYTVLIKRYSQGMSSIAANTHSMTAGLIVLWALLFLIEGRLLPSFFTSQEQWFAIGYLGLGSTGLAYLLYAWALSRLPMERVMPLIYLQPVVGVLLSVIWLGETLSLNIILGMCAIIGGLVWNHRHTRIPAQPDSARKS